MNNDEIRNKIMEAGLRKEEVKELSPEVQEALMESGVLHRMIYNRKCHGLDCFNEKRNGSKWCQDCSDKHKKNG